VTAVKTTFSTAKVHQSSFTIVNIMWCSKLPFRHSVALMCTLVIVLKRIEFGYGY